MQRVTEVFRRSTQHLEQAKAEQKSVQKPSLNSLCERREIDILLVTGCVYGNVVIVIEAAQRLNLAHIDLAASSLSRLRVAEIIATIKKSIAPLCSRQVHSSLFPTKGQLGNSPGCYLRATGEVMLLC